MAQSHEDPYIGKEAAMFCLPDGEGNTICLDSFRGNWVVLYFYPRDNTPGCTVEAMQFNAALEKFADIGAQVIGISADSPESHKNFAKKHNLSVLLLSDTEHAVLKASRFMEAKDNVWQGISRHPARYIPYQPRGDDCCSLAQGQPKRARRGSKRSSPSGKKKRSEKVHCIFLRRSAPAGW